MSRTSSGVLPFVSPKVSPVSKYLSRVDSRGWLKFLLRIDEYIADEATCGYGHSRSRIRQTSPVIAEAALGWNISKRRYPVFWYETSRLFMPQICL
jgi:hypothetical protein